MHVRTSRWLGLLLVLLLAACGSQRATHPLPTVVAERVDTDFDQDEQAAVSTARPLTRLPTATPAQQAAVPVFGYHVVNVYPHDTSAFTQGLIYHEGQLYEGTGLNGESSLRRVELATGQVLQRIDLPDAYFGEGIALFDDRIYQLTWQNKVGLIYDRASFTQIGTWSYETEGWGLTHDGRQLIMSDGSATIRFLDPQTLAVQRSIQVRAEGQPLTRLNELEYIDGQIYANIWQTDWIVRIDPQSGAVTAWIDLSGLLPPEERQPNTDVLNGIAYDPTTDRLFVTGKRWPKLYEIELVAPQASTFLPIVRNGRREA
jgi:glutamine cyclotransferase